MASWAAVIDKLSRADTELEESLNLINMWEEQGVLEKPNAMQLDVLVDIKASLDINLDKVEDEIEQIKGKKLEEVT